MNYHLLLLPSYILRKLRTARVGLFLHTPFPSSEIFRTIPVREELIRGMLNADLIGFHIFEYARHFLTCCRRILGVTHTIRRGGLIGIELAGREVVIVAGGLGLASQRAVVYRLAHGRAAYRSATLLLGAKRPEGLLYAAEHGSWRRAGIDVVPVVDAAAPGWSGRTGLVTGLLEELPLDPTRATILCCGPDQMIGAVAAVALRRGVAAEAIFVSLERNMGCGFGHCGLCQLGPFFVCHDGPVFRWDRVAPLLAVPGL